MKNKLSIFLVTMVVGIIAMELATLSFQFMNQSDTLLFYLGFIILGVTCFFLGWGFIKILNKLFPTEKNEENSK